MSKLEYFFDVDEAGDINPGSVERLLNGIRDKFPGASIRIAVEKKRKIRSLNQNRYYFGVIVAHFIEGAIEHWGEELDTLDAHANLKEACNWKEVASVKTGEIRKLTLSTKDLTTSDFEAYEERCRRLILEYFGSTVPLPNEQRAIDYYNQHANLRSKL